MNSTELSDLSTPHIQDTKFSHSEQISVAQMAVVNRLKEVLRAECILILAIVVCADFVYPLLQPYNIALRALRSGYNVTSYILQNASFIIVLVSPKFDDLLAKGYIKVAHQLLKQYRDCLHNTFGEDSVLIAPIKDLRRFA